MFELFGDNWLASRLMLLIPLLLSLTVHEWAHARAAYALGDDTAKQLGRLSLNPLVHMDPVGTLLLPLLGVPIGWAKPVPFNPVRFRRKFSIIRGTMLVAIAGPISNVLLAILAFLALQLYSYLPLPPSKASIILLSQLVLLNIVLAIFNMIPVPPLDGSKVLDAFIPRKFRSIWESFCGLGLTPLLVLVLILPILGIDPVGSLISSVVSFLAPFLSPST